jgi:hypothetical protein
MFGPSVYAMAAVYPVIREAADTPSTTATSAQASPVATDPATSSSSDACAAAAAQVSPTATLAATQPQALETIEVVAKTKKLDAARNGLSPDTGSTVYRSRASDMTNSYVAKVRAKEKAQLGRSFQIALGVAAMIAVGALGSYLAYVFYGHGCGC